MPRRSKPHPTLDAAAVKAAARSCGFPLVGLARAEPLDPAPLERWLDAGYAADMTWMRERQADRTDPRRVLDGVETVMALAIPYARPAGERSPVASYARGRDYHYAHRDRLKALRKRLLVLDPTLETYACVDTGVAMEKPWAERAGLGWIGKNGCLVTTTHGSWVTLSVMLLDRVVSAYDAPHPDRCGSCDRCLRGCPTKAFPAPGVVDARRCLSYQTIENHGSIPAGLRLKVVGHVFGCDVCQDVCPFNHGELPPPDPRFDPRPLGLMAEEEIAALSPEDYARLSPGMALTRVQYDGLRRNAIYALSRARAGRCRELLERLAEDPSPLVREAAVWVLDRT